MTGFDHIREDMASKERVTGRLDKDVVGMSMEDHVGKAVTGTTAILERVHNVIEDFVFHYPPPTE